MSETKILFLHRCHGQQQQLQQIGEDEKNRLVHLQIHMLCQEWVHGWIAAAELTEQLIRVD